MIVQNVDKRGDGAIILSDIPFVKLIQQVDDIQSATISDEIKLRQSGELICKVSEQILLKANTLLEQSQQSEIDETDTKIDRSFSDFLTSLTQQSISTNFMLEYLQPQPKTDYQRETTRSVKFLSATEAQFELAEDLIESEVISATARLAYDEDINAWTDRVMECLETNPQINTMLQIVEATNLSIAQVFISLLFGDFELVQLGNFYEGLKIKVMRH